MSPIQSDTREGEGAELIAILPKRGLMDLHYGQVDMILHSAPVAQCRI